MRKCISHNFTQTNGKGTWEISPKGELTLISDVRYHWLDIDLEGHFSRSNLIDFQRITPDGARPTAPCRGAENPPMLLIAGNPAVYGTTAACIVVVPDKCPDDSNVTTPAECSSVMPMIKPELSFSPLRSK
jgi:hypothetical protein